MRIKISPDLKTGLMQKLCIVLGIVMVMYDIVTHMILETILPGYRMALLLLCVVQLALLLRLYSRKMDITGRLLIWYVVWLGFTRAFVDGSGENVLQGEVLCAAQMGLLFSLGYLLQEDQREILLNCLTAVMVCVLLVWVFWAFRVLLSDVEMIRLTERRYVMLAVEKQKKATLRTIQFFDVHRNETAGFYMCAVWLLVNRFLVCRKKLWRIPIGIVIAVFLVMIAIMHSRTVQAITAIGFAMLAIMVLMERMKHTKLLPKLAVICLTAVLCVGISYKAMSVCDRLVSRLAEPHLPQKPQTAAVQNTQPAREEIQLVMLSHTITPAETVPATTEAKETTPAVTAPEKTDGMSDQRNFWKDLRTLTMRTEIWVAVMRVCRNYPSVMWFGQPENMVAQSMNDYGGLTRVVPHTHNALAQILLMCGALGALLMGAFLLILVIRMVKFFFSSSPVSEKVFLIPLTCILVDAVMEPLLTGQMEFESIFFAMLAGIFMSCCTKQKQSA